MIRPGAMGPGLLVASLLGALLAFPGPVSAGGESTRTRSETPNVSDATIRDAIARGVAFLVEDQNDDGSWGSPAPTLTLDILAPGKGSQDAFQVASSALALSGLLDAGGGLPGVEAAVRKGADWLLENHEARRDTARVLYNTWAHAYALEAFARLLEREKDPGRRAALSRAARAAVQRLERYEYVDGGWGYYDFQIGTQTPSHSEATSFSTATALVGLERVRRQGVEVPERLLRRATALVRRCRLPGGAFAYSFDLRYRRPWGVNKPEGSVARTPACLSGLIAGGVPVPTGRVAAAFDRLEKDGHFLLIARKYTYPHESWFQNSGYFCFYGYYYAGLLLDRLDPEDREFHRRRLAAHLVPLQEKGGAWWDYQLYRYHKPYGTGFVLMTLASVLAAAED